MSTEAATATRIYTRLEQISASLDTTPQNALLLVSDGLVEDTKGILTRQMAQAMREFAALAEGENA